MVLDFKVNARLVVGMTINFFYALNPGVIPLLNMITKKRESTRQVVDSPENDSILIFSHFDNVSAG